MEIILVVSFLRAPHINLRLRKPLNAMPNSTIANKLRYNITCSYKVASFVGRF